MTQPNKKPSSANPTAKLASSATNKAARDAFAAVESTRSSAENVVNIGSKAVREFISSSADEAQKAQDKAFAIGRENVEQFAKSADAVSKVLYEAIGISRDNISTCVECGNIAASLAKDISSETVEAANKALADNLEISKEFFSCRTINDMVELQNRVLKHNIDNFFNQSVKLSNMFFEYSSEALEPINERVAEATEQFSKALTA